MSFYWWAFAWQKLNFLSYKSVNLVDTEPRTTSF